MNMRQKKARGGKRSLQSSSEPSVSQEPEASIRRPSQTTAAMLIFHALEPTHCGSGQSGEGVDKLILRDKTTSWPVFSPESIKGMLRGVCVEWEYLNSEGKERSRSKWNEDPDEKITSVFGPWNIVGPETAFAGALSVSTAHILALPVASHPGVFTWVTCPEAIRKFSERMIAYEIAAEGTEPIDCPWQINDHQFAAIKNNLRNNELRLGRHRFQIKDELNITNCIELIANHASHLFLRKERLENGLVIVSDEAFSYFVKHELHVSMHNSLDADTKKVIDGRLFSIESLPAETLMYAAITTHKPRTPASDDRPQKLRTLEGDDGLLDSFAVMDYVKDAVKGHRNIIQIGAGASTGHGTCYLNWSE